MEKDIILQNLHQLKDSTTIRTFYGVAAELKNLISSYAGNSSSFYQAVEKINFKSSLASEQLNGLIKSFTRAVENDLVSGPSFIRKIQLEIVSDFLAQAEDLLNIHDFHPANAVVLIGASLEEFLRNWVFEIQSENEDIKQNISGYVKHLRTLDLITKQDQKEIAVWAGLRNSAAHGLWNEVTDRDKIILMLKGVSVFIKQYSK